MIIKTITCHDVYNVGASLQAYALMKYLEELGNDVSIIDYKPNYLSHHYELFYADNPAYRKNVLTKLLYVVAKLPVKLSQQKRKRIFNNFTRKYLKLTKRYESNEELKRNCPYADIYIAGSDQIWNPLFQNGKDPAFYLDFAPDTSVKATYAASFAVNSFPVELVDKTAKMLNKMDFISVREKTGLDVLEQLGITNCCEVLDPVFLLPKEQWNDVSSEKKIIKEKYVLVYDFEKSDVIRAIAQKIAQEKQLKVVTLFKTNYSDINYTSAGPLEFLNLVRNAEYIISNSFHATAFAVIFEKKFCVVGRKENINSRMVDLLCKIGLSNQYVTSSECIPYTIDYSQVNEQLGFYIKYSKNFLHEVLERRKT